MRWFLRRLRAALLGLLDRCERCAGQMEKHDLCLYCSGERFCHRCGKQFYVGFAYGQRREQ